MAVTITDVAKLAGVSHTTVSWVIHDDPRITEKTKDKVMKAIKELDYHPNLMARSLVKGKTNNIAIVAPFFSSSFEMEILRGIEDGMDANKSSKSISMYSARGNHEKFLKQILLEKRADAVILLTIKPDVSIIGQFEKNKIPLILVEEDARGCSVIRTNNQKGARLAVEALIGKGRKKIAIAVETEDYGLSQIDRLRGYKEALGEHDIDYGEELIISINKYRFEEGQRIFQQILDVQADAVFCAAGDAIAMGILLEARNRNIKIPQEISVVGFDDSSMCELVYPSLSTIRQPLYEMGKKAWEMAINPESHDNIVFEPEYIKREST